MNGAQIGGLLASLFGLAGLALAVVAAQGLLDGSGSPALAGLFVGGLVAFFGGWAVSVLYAILVRLGHRP